MKNKLLFLLSFSFLNFANAQINDTICGISAYRLITKCGISNSSYKNLKHELTISYDKRSLEAKLLSIDYKRVTSTNIFYTYRLKKFKKGNFNILGGVNYRYYSLAYYKKTAKFIIPTEDIKLKNRQIGLNIGFNFDRVILKYKKHWLYFGIGAFLNKSIYNPTFSRTYTYAVQGKPNKDSIVIAFNKNKQLNLYPFMQLKAKTIFKKQALIYGIRLNIANKLNNKTNINHTEAYNLNSYYLTNNVSYLDNSNQWEFYLGVAF